MATLPARTLDSAIAAMPQVLIVDDSAVARAVIARALQDGQFGVAGAVANADAALEFLRHRSVAAVVLDIEMPGVSGLAALPDLIVAGQGAKVLIVSSAAAEGAAATLEALALGAADTLLKPGVGEFAGRFSVAIVNKLRRLIVAEPPLDPPPLAPRRAGPDLVSAAVAIGHGFDIVGIGASTGGIHALAALLRELPAAFQTPILITQHLPTSFMPFFAAQVATMAARPCDVATDSMRVRPGRIVVAPGDAHLRVVNTGDGAAIRLSGEARSSGCMPSVDPMFASLAEVYGPRALGIVLSGMGRDGSEGARVMVDRGAVVLAQDRASSVVWGMPGAIATAGLASALLPPREIGRLVATPRRRQ